MDIDLLNKMVEDKLVLRQKHPVLDLYIYNYSPVVQYEKLWDDITLQTRGLVLDGDGNIVARPFKKFFNLSEHSQDEFPNESFEVFEKMDGSLGILFNYKGEWHMVTRGSFTSEQANKGKEMLKKYPIEKLDKNKTYLFEIIY